MAHEEIQHRGRSLAEIDRAKRVKLFRNGDRRFYGKELVLNRRRVRTWDSFLQVATADLKTKNAVRSICTPRHGTQITSLDQLNDHENYVAIDGGRFKSLRYLELEKDDVSLRHSPRRTEKHNNYSPFSDPEVIKPVVHNKKYRLFSARFKKVPTDAITIFVYANGKEWLPARKMTLTHHMMDQLDWTSMLSLITTKVDLTTGACRKLYALDGHQITDKSQFRTGEYYIAVGKESLKMLPYDNHSKPEFRYSPRLAEKNQDQQGEKRRPRGLYSRTTTTTTGKTASGSTSISQASNVSGASRSSNKSPKKTRSSHSDFHAHENRDQSPAQSKPPLRRGPELFRAQYEQKEAQGATTVAESKDTKTEVPIDQRQAETIQEEYEEYRAPSRRSERDRKKSGGSHEWDLTKAPTPVAQSRERSLVQSRQMSAKEKSKTDINIHENDRPESVKSEAPSYPQETARGSARSRPDTVRSAAPSDHQETDRRSAGSRRSARKDKQMEDEQAAIKIQAGYRGYRVRRDMRLKRSEDERAVDTGQETYHDQEEETYRTVEEEVDPRNETYRDVEEERYSPQPAETYRLDESGSSEKEKAAIKIQANYRGYKVRKDMKSTAAEQSIPAEDQPIQDRPESEQHQPYDEPADEQHDDPQYEAVDREYDEAAVKIQAAYRGYQARKQVAQMKPAN